MKRIIKTKDGKEVIYNMNDLTGSVSIIYDNKPTQKIDKKLYSVSGQKETFYISTKGNYFSGFSVVVDGYEYEVTKGMSWYESILIFVPFILTMAIGNISWFALNGFYYVGGFIGGAISGLFVGLSLIFCTKTNKHLFRLLIILCAIVLAFLICWGLGSAIIKAASNKGILY